VWSGHLARQEVEAEAQQAYEHDEQQRAYTDYRWVLQRSEAAAHRPLQEKVVLAKEKVAADPCATRP
jgi:hypothetical protein